MAATGSLPALNIPLTKERDYAPHSEPASPSKASRNVQTKSLDSDTDTTATNSDDEFDWDNDDEFSRPDLTERKKAKRFRALWVAFMMLARPIRVILLSILGAGILITPFIVVHLEFRQNVVYGHVRLWSLWFSIAWAAGCVTYLVVDGLPRLIVAVTWMFGGQLERIKMQLELTSAVSGWIKLALDISWAWIALSVLREVYKPPGTYWSTINRVMQALFAAGIIILVEKVFLHFVAINFHERALADRLSENRAGLKALDRLSNAQFSTPTSRKHYSFGIGKGEKGHKHNASSLGNMDGIAMQPKSGPSSVESSPIFEKLATNPKDMSKSARKQRRKKAMASIIVDQVGGAIGQVALKNSRFNREGEIGGLHSARRLARKLFSALSQSDPPRSHLVVDDFIPYFRSEEEAKAAFVLFDKDGNGDITKKEMREAVQRIYRERKALTASLKDVGSIVAKLDAVLLCIALLIILFAALLIFNRKNTLASLVPLATIVLGFSFIFGHSAQTLFESLIFIFSTHVFDVGDLVMIDDQPLFVREFGLFSTTFRRVDGQEIIAPNALLASAKLIHNLRRSNSMWETTKLMVAYDTPLEKLEELRNKISAYVQANNRDWSGCALNIDKMEYQNAIHLIVAIEHRPNWQDWGGRWARRTAFMRNLKTVLEELDLRYSMPVQPVILPPPPPQYQSMYPRGAGFRSTSFGTSPYGGATYGGSAAPSSLNLGGREDLGNAGTFTPGGAAGAAAGQTLRAPGPVLREGPGFFSGSAS
ncbi:EF-hand domain-containing protein [Pleurotus pulmonarius]